MSPVCIIHYTMHIICNMYSLVMIVNGISVQLSSSSALGNRVYVGMEWMSMSFLLFSNFIVYLYVGLFVVNSSNL